MSNVSITINGGITVNFGSNVPAELENVISELAEVILEDCETDDNNGEGFTIAMIFPDQIREVFDFNACAPVINGMEHACEFHIEGERFNLLFERKELMSMFGENYLVIPAFALFHDEQGKPVSADAETLKALNDYIHKNRTEFRFGEETFAALRLEGKIVEGI